MDHVIDRAAPSSKSLLNPPEAMTCDETILAENLDLEYSGAVPATVVGAGGANAMRTPPHAVKAARKRKQKNPRHRVVSRKEHKESSATVPLQSSGAS